jgi:hypothetical protein
LIRIKKPRKAPSILKQGVPLVKQMLADHAAGKGFTKADSHKFDREIYASKDVKSELLYAQHGKCCYCESKPLATSWGDVEHFRPKAAYSLGQGKPLIYPGYFWLAYSWPNLYFSCEICNRALKKNFFPLEEETQRVLNPRSSTKAEVPLILDPGGAEDPRSHIVFNNELPVGLTPRGMRTIELLGLERSDLNQDRLDHIQVLDLLCDVAARGDDLSERARVQLRKYSGLDAKFSAMCCDFLESRKTRSASPA